MGVVRAEWRLFREHVRADHQALSTSDRKYASAAERPANIVSAGIQRIGFQMMIAYRVMRLCRGIGFGIGARLTSRLIRHIYGADIHWDAEMAPGVVIVHGLGLVISSAARVDSGCILFHHVTLGINIDAVTRETGAPCLERNVHVGPGAVLLGPIVVGIGTKVTANVLLTCSTPPNSRVEGVAPTIRLRGES